MSPLTACGTEVKLNGTHVEYKNKLIAGNDASVLQKGAVIVGTADSTSRQTLAAKLKCLFPVELMVSTAFLPNISHVTIPGRVLTRKQADSSSRFKLIYPIFLSEGLDERLTIREWWFEHTFTWWEFNFFQISLFSLYKKSNWIFFEKFFWKIVIELKKLPPAYGIGKFMATMHLYKTDQYLETYQSNPQLNTGDYLNVG